MQGHSLKGVFSVPNQLSGIIGPVCFQSHMPSFSRSHNPQPCGRDNEHLPTTGQAPVANYICIDLVIFSIVYSCNRRLLVSTSTVILMFLPFPRQRNPKNKLYLHLKPMDQRLLVGRMKSNIQTYFGPRKVLGLWTSGNVQFTDAEICTCKSNHPVMHIFYMMKPYSETE